MVSGMGGRREDSARGQARLPPVPPPGAPVGSRPPAPLPAPAVDEQRSAGGRGWLVVGLVLATGATAAVVLTDDPLYLRVALLAVCWTFVVATFLPGSRRSD